MAGGIWGSLQSTWWWEGQALGAAFCAWQVGPGHPPLWLLQTRDVLLHPAPNNSCGLMLVWVEMAQQQCGMGVLAGHRSGCHRMWGCCCWTGYGSAGGRCVEGL
jgi:hypothetical protein